MHETSRAILEDLFFAAIRSAEPGDAVSRALSAHTITAATRLHVISLGKAAERMAESALAFVESRGIRPISGMIIAPGPGRGHLTLPQISGGHPIPDSSSFAAAGALEQLVSQVHPGDEVWVLLSGGATSLIAAPVDGVEPDDLVALYTTLLASGLDIHRVNLIRKRFSRWGAGRLALALAGARVRVLALSDVPGNNPASIGSGPCTPDPSTAPEVRRLLEERRLAARLPQSLGQYLTLVEQGQVPETPKPDDPAFSQVTFDIVADNATALDGARNRARELGLAVSVEPPLTGDADEAGRGIADRLARLPSDQRSCQIWGGETTVTLSPGSGLGGRSQELALAAAVRLAKRQMRAAILAAGTDGRDGPTDAAGAIVDQTTFASLRGKGVDADDALRQHDAYNALDKAGALFRTGPTGTNVMDLVIGLVLPA